MITIYGASDDLIEVEGSIREEFPFSGAAADGGDLLAFSNGVVLRVTYTPSGVWRIQPVSAPAHVDLTITHAPEDDDDDYSDRAELEDAAWVVHGTGFAKGRESDGSE